MSKTVWAFGLAWLLTLSTATQSQQPRASVAEWFAERKPRPFTSVIEAETVPKTFVGNGRMRFVEPGGGGTTVRLRDLSRSRPERGGQCAKTRRRSSNLHRPPALPLQGWNAEWCRRRADEACG